ncbi:branched-chain amino acid ABC transporter permease [Actinomadura sp. 1N219]|uniref:branched-chain amino acid ABC transporter permease n=1 Tax=Actinomadura sp. 1N219 TaxID=3375152 RepID=UPI00378A8A92
MIGQLLVGAAIGCLYALIAQGFTLTFRTTGTMNFAVGEFVAIGAFVALGLAGVAWLPAPAKLVVAALLVALLGALVFRFLIRPFLNRGAHDVRWLLVTVALSMLLVDMLRNSQGTQHRPMGFAKADGLLDLGIARLPTQLALMAVVCLALVVAIALLVTRTGLGTRMQAVAEDAETAELVGIDARRTGLISYALGSGAAVIGASLWIAYVGVFPDVGPLLLVSAFAAAVIGGLGSVWGVLAGGLIFGVTDQMMTVWFDATVGSIAGLVAVIAILVVRPAGLFAQRQEVKV